MAVWVPGVIACSDLRHISTMALTSSCRMLRQPATFLPAELRDLSKTKLAGSRWRATSSGTLRLRFYRLFQFFSHTHIYVYMYIYICIYICIYIYNFSLLFNGTCPHRLIPMVSVVTASDFCQEGGEGDWPTKYAPWGGVEGPRGLTPPAALWVLSVDSDSTPMVSLCFTFSWKKRSFDVIKHGRPGTPLEM